MFEKQDLQVFFEKNLDRLWSKNRFDERVCAVGVSGGADSLALALLLQNWCQKRGIRLVALTVDHRLRKESAQEASFVAEVMKKFGIFHQVLVWEGDKPQKGIEEAAREARYDLIASWSQKNQVDVLFVAHHLRDQAETFLMRLQRGSGVDGLACMQDVSYRKGLKIVRPLLSVPPEDLRDFLRKNNLEWVEDPSNQEDDFLRVRVRKILPELYDKIGLTQERLADTAERMSRVRDFFEKQTEDFVCSNVCFYEQSGCSFAWKNWQVLHEEMRLRVLSFLLRKVGKKVYPPRLDDLENLASSLMQENFRGRTLCGCEIFVQNKKVWLTRENENGFVLPRKVWDDFVLNGAFDKKKKLPYKLRVALFLEKNKG